MKKIVLLTCLMFSVVFGETYDFYLDEAFFNKNYEAVYSLIDQNLTNKKDENGHRMLDYVLNSIYLDDDKGYEFRTKMIDILIKNDLEVDYFLENYGKNLFTPFSLLMALPYENCERIEISKKLISKSNDINKLIEIYEKNGDSFQKTSVLYYAFYYKNMEMFEFYLNIGLRENNLLFAILIEPYYEILPSLKKYLNENYTPDDKYYKIINDFKFKESKREIKPYLEKLLKNLSKNDLKSENIQKIIKIMEFTKDENLKNLNLGE
ncbi:hypothetical protein [Campylobacter ureolyticus]|uniref:hypothetical protein n=1 Tax=Campylobacter ureolyticus TaxID=827 RepID=UPI001FC81D81|nr:hypothetical protein [Campylobacter ureolyticus]MCZ6105366.1 hypothetical protein [Campylobacter ureolyticus]MCZ6157589.1 hypothetical protein [Campylobacter ureolyticus]GKH60874.1 hypothetical protein CE91St25_12100 [Campylobacter ureolyticus]